jgi:hypothetical protein
MRTIVCERCSVGITKSFTIDPIKHDMTLICWICALTTEEHAQYLYHDYMRMIESRFKELNTSVCKLSSEIGNLSPSLNKFIQALNKCCGTNEVQAIEEEL